MASIFVREERNRAIESSPWRVRPERELYKGPACDWSGTTWHQWRIIEYVPASAMAVVSHCIDIAQDTRCLFCNGTSRGSGGNMRSLHDEDCPLVVNGFITREGTRLDGGGK